MRYRAIEHTLSRTKTTWLSHPEWNSACTATIGEEKGHADASPTQATRRHTAGAPRRSARPATRPASSSEAAQAAEGPPGRMTILRPWWERFPELLREEEADLERLGGRPPILNQDLLRIARVRQYDVPYTFNGTTYPLTVTYSDFHPFFRVEVTTTHSFRTHQHPFAGNLCLIRGGTWNWNVDETAAQLIESQMPLLLADNAEHPHARHAPNDNKRNDHVEPFVGYYTYAPRAAIRVDGGWPDVKEAERGTLVIGLDRPPDPDALRATVLQVLDEGGTIVREADPAILAGDPDRIAGRWCRLPARPDADSARAVLDAAIEVSPEFSRPARQQVGREHELDVVGIVFTDGTRPGVDGDAWMFVIQGRGPRPPQRSGGGRVAPPRKQVGPYIARAFRCGRKDMTERVPALSPLAGKKVVLFGPGGVGAPSAIEFAKAGLGTLVAVEFELIEPGNAPRWALGYQAVGLHKLEGLHQLVRWNWPYTTIELRHLRLGSVRDRADTTPEWRVVDEILDGADLIYDATAEVGVNYFLSELAKERAVPYVVASTTEGGWGGRVARFRAGAHTACWTCLMHHELDAPEMIPPADPDPATHSVWPAGCTDPTFTGTGFDIATISMAGLRLAASTLCEGHNAAYPPADWDLAVYEFRNANSTMAGAAKTYALKQHPDCEPCRIRRSG